MIALGTIAVVVIVWTFVGAAFPIRHYSKKQQQELQRVKIHDADRRTIDAVWRSNPLRKK